MAFGSAVTKIEETTGEVKVNPWNNPPDFSEVRDAIITVGIIEAEIESLNLEISEIKRQIKRGSRKADVTEEAEEATVYQRTQLTNAKSRLAVARANEKWFLYWKEIFKGTSFKER